MVSTRSDGLPPAGRLPFLNALSSLSVTVDGARYFVETPIQPTIPEDGLGRLAGGKKRQDTNFKFEVVLHDDMLDSAESLGGRKRTDTSFEFEIAASESTPDGTEALTKKSRTDTSFKFERAATPTDGSLTIIEIQERLGGPDLPDEAPTEAGRKRSDTSFSFEVATREGGAVGVRVSVTTGSTRSISR